jgi:hypothetical protein
MKEARLAPHTLILVAALLLSSSAGSQVIMPSVNMGATSFLDGVAGPGLLLEPGVIEHYHAGRFVDSNGMTIPGKNSIEAWTNLFHLGLITTHKIFGAFYGAEFLVPVSSLDIKTAFGPNGSQSGLGDIVVSPLILEWPNRTLFGKSYFSRFSVLANLPTGAYDPERAVNIGSNAGGGFAYYSFTIGLAPKLETSWRFNYLWNAKNSQPFVPLAVNTTQAGQAVHVNYAMSYGLFPSLRVGVNGYAFQQLTDHRLGAADLAHSRERVVALGPGIMWSSGFWSVIANVDFETLARNRPEGQRVNVTLRRVFPR